MTVFSAKLPRAKYRAGKYTKMIHSALFTMPNRRRPYVLLIPRRHIATLVDCAPQDAPLLGRMMMLTAQLAAQLGVAYRGADAGGTGFRTVINTGPGGGQEIYHLHAHLLGGKRPWSRM